MFKKVMFIVLVATPVSVWAQPEFNTPRTYNVNVNSQPQANSATPQVNFNPAPQANPVDAAMNGYQRGQQMRLNNQQIEMNQMAIDQARQSQFVPAQQRPHEIDALVAGTYRRVGPRFLSDKEITSLCADLADAFRKMNRGSDSPRENKIAFDSMLKGFESDPKNLVKADWLMAWVNGMEIAAYNLQDDAIYEEMGDIRARALGYFRALLVNHSN